MRIAVVDKGDPVPAEQREKIFDQYYQAEASRQGRFLGIGYGRIYFRLVAEFQGGTLSVEPIGKDEARSPAVGRAVEPIGKDEARSPSAPIPELPCSGTHVAKESVPRDPGVEGIRPAAGRAVEPPQKRNRFVLTFPA